MSAYRFCRTDDIALLVDALNRCWSPYFPGEPPMTPATFKRSIRELQVWCSSCMVSFSGSDPIGVLIGAKRPWGTLIHRIAVHPEHRRQGHGRHLLASLGSKLAILGPPRIVAEVPESLGPACELFSATGFVREAALTDYVLQGEGPRPQDVAGTGIVIPITVDDLAANGLLEGSCGRACWQRATETLLALKDDIHGLAVASDEGIEACILYLMCDADPGRAVEVVWMRSFVDDGGARLGRLVARLRSRGIGTLRFPKVHPEEIPKASLATLGFRPVGEHLLYAATARAN